MSEPADVSQRKEWVAGLFNRAGPTYDHIGPAFFSYFGKKLVEFAQIKHGDNVLDVATGRGAVLFAAARAVGRGGSVIGTDLAQSMVNETRQEIHVRKLDHVKVELMDAESLSFTDETFDCVLCGFALFFFPQLDKALAEMRRVLRAGGCLAVTTWEKYEDKRWDWYDELARKFIPPEDEKPADSGTPPPELDTWESMEFVLAKAGFVGLQYKSEQFESTYRNEEEWWSTQWSHGGRALLERIEKMSGAEGLEKFRKATFVGLKRMKESDGIHSHWPALCTKAIKGRE